MNWLRARPWAVYGAVFLGFLLLHVFIFRDVVAAIPAILQGQSVIVREELIPFFNFTSQFIPSGASALSGSDEVRVAYSFWTAWVRHYAVLPFALVLLNALSAFMLFYAFHRIARYVTKNAGFGIIAAVLAALLIHTILLYSKISHFYVLIIGFSMFSLAATLAAEQIFMKRNLQKRNVAAVSLLVLFNPAIHFHVIFYLLLLLVVGTHLLFTYVMNRAYFWHYFKKNMLYTLLVTALSALPYIPLIIAATNMSSVSTQIPVNYWMVYYASLALPFVFSMDSAGHLDLIRYGNYLAPFPRFGTIIVMVMIGWLFISSAWKKLHLAKRVFLLMLFIALLLSMWMSIGFAPNTPISFHAFLGAIALFFAEQGNALAQGIGQILSAFINILRFPHRFQFITFYVAGVLLTIALVWLYDALHRRFGKRALAGVLVTLLALFPILASGDYRQALSSGDLAAFAAPYRIPEDLNTIKAHLHEERKESRMFVLPTLESGREILQDDRSYSFLDKFLIYYLDQPTLYYGVGANTEHKIVTHLAYQAIKNGEPWWEDVLVHSLGVTHLLVPVTIADREYGITYMPGIEDDIANSLNVSDYFEKVHDGDIYDLYRATSRPDPNRRTLVDLEWQRLLEHLQKEHEPHQTDSSLYFPIQLRALTKDGNRALLASDSIERSFYKLYAHRTPALTFLPDTTALPFQNKLVASTIFTNNALSLSTLQDRTDVYNHLREIIPSLAGLHVPQFTGITPGDAGLNIKLHVPHNGTYRVLVHGATRDDVLHIDVGGIRLPLQKVAGDQDLDRTYLDFTYFYADLELIAGNQIISIRNTSDNSVLIESLTLMPENEIPDTFDEGVDQSGIRIKPLEEEYMHEVEWR